MAEAEKLKKEAWMNRVNRSKLRMKGQEKEEEISESDAPAQQTEAADPETEVSSGSELTNSVNPEPTTTTTTAAAKERLLMFCDDKGQTTFFSPAMTCFP